MLELTKEIREPKHTNPKTQIIYGLPKSGKTAIVSGLSNHLILELEPGGGDYISGRIQELNKPSELGQALELIENAKEKICDYLIIDTATKLDEWSEIVGTYNYMNTTQGKDFNVVGSGDNKRKMLHTEKDFETVHQIPHGYGYQHSRAVMVKWIDRLTALVQADKVSYVILLAHVQDKYIESKSGDAVQAIDLNLTGKVKSIYSSRVDAIGYFNRKGESGFLNYNNDFNVVSGGRCSHLNGSIHISSRKEDNSIETFWERVYI